MTPSATCVRAPVFSWQPKDTLVERQNVAIRNLQFLETPNMHSFFPARRRALATQRFEFDPLRKHMLLKGLDAVGLTLESAGDIK